MSRNHSWGWGAQSASPPTTKSVMAVQREPIQLTSDTRSYIAHLIYPDLSREDAGRQVVRDIHADPTLLATLRALGYKSNAPGYSPQEIRTLLKYYGVV